MWDFDIRITKLLFPLIHTIALNIFVTQVNTWEVKLLEWLQHFRMYFKHSYGFRSSRSTTDLLTIVSDRIATAFNRSGATQSVAFDISKAGFDMLVFFTNLRLMDCLVRYLALFLLFSAIDGFEWFWMEILYKNNQLMLDFLKVPFLVLHFYYYTLMIFLMMLSDVAIYADDTAVCSKCDHSSDLWQQLELASELESDLWDTVDWGKKWLLDFNAGKTQLVSFDWSDNNGSIDVKMDGSVLEEKLSFKMLGLTFSSKLVCSPFIISIAKKVKLPLRRLEF